MMHLRNKMAADSQINEDWCNYKQVRNQLNNRMKYEEKQWQRNRLKECKHDSSSTWKVSKSILNWASSGTPSKLFHNGKLWHKPQ